MRTHRQMDATSAKKIVDTFSDAVKTVPLMGEDRNDNEYRRALALVEFL
ncbi:transcriptional regulator, partial [Salmonella enterica subsp. enterica serovar Kentucky]|nr:transcriptional regulator [Salmonella enterica subsp. enterica serovar Kentucky]